MRMVSVAAISTVVMLGLWGATTQGPRAQTGAPAQPKITAPSDKAAYFANSDIQTTWKNLESRNVINKRVLEGGAYSINVRIVTENLPPLVHSKSADVWIMTAGSGTAVTGGELVDPKHRGAGDDVAGTSIRGGIEQPLHPGDILYVPPGVPHGFKDVKGFRAFLIRFDTELKRAAASTRASWPLRFHPQVVSRQLGGLCSAAVARLFELIEQALRPLVVEGPHYVALAFFLAELDGESLLAKVFCFLPFIFKPVGIQFTGIHIDAQFRQSADARRRGIQQTPEVR